VRFIRTTFALAALVNISLAAVASAETPAATVVPTPPTQDTALDQQKSLEGHVQGEAVALGTGLRDLAKTLHHLKRSAYDIFVEVQRQNMVVVGEPDVIGPIIIPAIPSPSGMLGVGGFLEPRKKFLDYFMSQVIDLSKMTQSEVSGLVLPADASDDAKSDLKIISDTAAALNQDIAALQEVTQGPKYDNFAIARAAQLMQNHVQEIEKASKKLDSEAKREVSKTKKDMRDLDKQIKKNETGK
jgi:hypothetical protein